MRRCRHIVWFVTGFVLLVVTLSAIGCQLVLTLGNRNETETNKADNPEVEAPGPGGGQKTTVKIKPKVTPGRQGTKTKEED